MVLEGERALKYIRPKVCTFNIIQSITSVTRTIIHTYCVIVLQCIYISVKSNFLSIQLSMNKTNQNTTILTP
jgi:hypothetical protein